MASVVQLPDPERLYKAVFEHYPDSIFIEDMDGKVLDVNTAACRLHGLSHEELIGKHVSDLVPPEYRDSVVHSQELLDREVEGYSLTADGRQIPVSIRSCSVPYMGGTALLLQVRDITERRRAEEALRESESRYRLMFNSSPQAMWVYDVQTRGILAVNEAALNIYRYSREEFLAMGTIDAINAEPIAVSPELLQQPNLIEISVARHRRKNGSPLTVQLSQHTMLVDGRLVSFVIINTASARVNVLPIK